MSESKLKLVIGSNDVTDALVGYEHTRSINEAARLMVSLQSDYELLSACDLAGNVTLEALVEDQLTRLFSGIVLETKIVSDIITVQCSDTIQYFKEMPARDAFGKGLHPTEIIYYMAKTTDGVATHPKNFYVDKQKTLADIEIFDKARKYIFITPASFVELNVDEMDVADITLYRADSVGAQDDKNMAACLSNGVIDKWVDGRTMVRFYVTAAGFIDAIEQGRNRLRKFIDYCSFGASLSTPCYKIGGNWHHREYVRGHTLTGITETDWVYVRDTLNPARYWLHGFQSHKSGSAFLLASEDSVLDIHPILIKLLETDVSRLTSRERALVNSLHALRQSRQSANALDALVHLWNSIEFLLAGYDAETLFTKQDRKSITAAAVAVVDERYQQIGGKELDERRERVKRLLESQLNKKPLRSVWNAFCRDRGVSITVDDHDFLWSQLRNFRNDHQHGRQTSLNRRDVNRGCSIVEKLLLSACEVGSEPGK